MSKPCEIQEGFEQCWRHSHIHYGVRKLWRSLLQHMAAQDPAEYFAEHPICGTQFAAETLEIGIFWVADRAQREERSRLR